MLCDDSPGTSLILNRGKPLSDDYNSHQHVGNVLCFSRVPENLPRVQRELIEHHLHSQCDSSRRYFVVASSRCQQEGMRRASHHQWACFYLSSINTHPRISIITCFMPRTDSSSYLSILHPLPTVSVLTRS